MRCTVEQESGVHGIPVIMPTRSWVVPSQGATRATVLTGRTNYCSSPVALQCMPF